MNGYLQCACSAAFQDLQLELQEQQGRKPALLCAAYLLTVINDALLPCPPPCRSAHEATGSSEVFTNGWQTRQTSIVRPQGGERKEMPNQLAPY